MSTNLLSLRIGETSTTFNIGILPKHHQPSLFLHHENENTIEVLASFNSEETAKTTMSKIVDMIYSYHKPRKKR